MPVDEALLRDGERVAREAARAIEGHVNDVLDEVAGDSASAELQNVEVMPSVVERSGADIVLTVVRTRARSA